MCSRDEEFETYYLTCPVCGALPGTSCIEDYQELERVHPSRRMSVAERNRRHAASGWEPPELVERRRRERDAEAASAPPPSTGTRAELDRYRPRPEAPIMYIMLSHAARCAAALDAIDDHIGDQRRFHLSYPI
jgi:hypothetical protein